MQWPVVTWDFGNKVCCCCFWSLLSSGARGCAWPQVVWEQLSSHSLWLLHCRIGYRGLGWKFRTAKSPNCTIWWKSTYTASLGPLVWILWVQRCPEWGAALLEHSPAVPHTGTVWILPFPCSVSSSEAGTEEKAEQGCKTLLPGDFGAAQPPLVLPGVGKMCHDMRLGEWASLSQGQSQTPEISPIHAPAAEQGGDLYRAPCNCDKLRTLPLRLLGARGPLGFVKAWKHLWFIWFNLNNYMRVLVCKGSKVVLESLKLKKSSKIIKANLQTNTIMPTQSCHEVPCLLLF